jgi:geranylgeranyl reductase family protein
MDSCDVLIVGGGPAGSSCAWKLRGRGLDVAILDKQAFPRNKVCGGWITPEVLDKLEIDPDEYGRGRVLQPITAFRTGSAGGSVVETDFGRPISYGILRRDFDHYLLERSGARILTPASLGSLERSREKWIANGNIQARVVVGAGGHFCPVARLTGAKAREEDAVVAQEAEFEMNAAQLAGCRVRGDTPELYFCPDMKGYGWCFRKHNFLNVGLGRMDQRRLPEHVARFLGFLKSTGRLLFDVPTAFHGHAYLLQGVSTRNVAADSLLLTGDAAGLAYQQSGEGIRPAIESGLLAAETIIAAQGRYGRERLEFYRTELGRRFGKSDRQWMSGLGRRLPPRLANPLARLLLGTRWFTRDVVLERWFLHWNEPRQC